MKNRYVDNYGYEYIAEKNYLIYSGRKREQIIGANYTNGTGHGGYLSSYSDEFTEETIGIAGGVVEVINAKIGNIKEAYELLKLKIVNIDINNIFEVSRVVLETIDEYFGGFKNIKQRMDYYYPKDEEESKNNTIANLRGTGAAMCTERAALAHNLLKSLGINSVFKTSGIILNNNEEVHSYNLIEYNNKYYIFDPSITNVINDCNNPLICEIDKESFDLISSPFAKVGISILVKHFDPYSNRDVEITYDSQREKQIEVESLSSTNKKNL